MIWNNIVLVNHLSLIKKYFISMWHETLNLTLAEVARLEKEKLTDYERFEFAKANLNQRIQQLERDSQLALTQEKQAHEEDVERLTQERVSIGKSRGLCQYIPH